MELLQLKYFCDAAESENFSKTANKFGVPPSDISQSVRRLESELGVSLFVRHANKVTLGEKGVEFLTRAKRALDLLDEAKKVVIDDINCGRLNICINANRRVVMQALEKYKSVYPNVEIRTTHFSDPAGEDFDIIISGESEGYEGYIRTKLISEGISIAMRVDNPHAQAASLDPSAFSDESFITMTEKSSLLGLTKKICADFGFTPRITIQSDDPFYVRKCVELGLGVAIVPSFSWQGQFSDEIVLREITGYLRDTFLYLNTGKYVTRSAREFCDILIAECAQ